MKILIGCICVLMLCMSGCGSKVDGEKTSKVSRNTASQIAEVFGNNIKTYQDKDFNFTYPGEWVQNSDLINQSQSIKVSLFDPKPFGGSFYNNVQVAVAMLGATAREAANATSELLANDSQPEIGEYKKVSYEDEKDGTGVLISEYHHIPSDEDVILTEYFVPHGEYLYTLSITFEKSLYDSGGSNMVQKMVESFNVNPNAEKGQSFEDFKKEHNL
ncbi:PsbP-related protein [Paenibacillus sp. OAE614]|uniref:PsbP-related protein n=1 Tax=Paenibacillus sp. OAE614 TaxID=2663804 RepID=UPI00178BCDEC